MGILQARILEWNRTPPPRDLPNPGIELRCLALQADDLLSETPGKPEKTEVGSLSLHQDLPNPGIKPGSPTLQTDSLPAKLSGKPHHHYKVPQSINLNSLNSQKQFHGMSQCVSHSYIFSFPSTSWDVWNTREKQNKKQLFSRDYITKIS